MQNDLSPKLRCVQGQRFANTVAGARDQDNAVFENVAPILVMIWLDTQEWLPASRVGKLLESLLIRFFIVVFRLGFDNIPGQGFEGLD